MNYGINDTVVCISAVGSFGIKAGEKYKVRDIYTCDCPTTLVDIGVFAAGRCTCVDCSCDVRLCTHRAWRFVKLDDGVAQETRTSTANCWAELPAICVVGLVVVVGVWWLL